MVADGLHDYYMSSNTQVMPDAEGLGPLEMNVLGLLDARTGSTVSDVRARLRAAGGELAYTTVMTVLVRLHRKGVVERRKEGAHYLYFSAKKAPRVSATIFARIKRSLFGSDRTRPIVALLQDDDLSPEDLRALRTVIDERLARRRR